MFDFAYAQGPTDSPRPEETIGERLRLVSERFPDREALVVAHQDYRATYRELWREVELAARALIANGVNKGDRVGIWAPNRYEWAIVQYATARVGAVLVTINPAYKAGELRHALRKAGVSLLFMARGFRGADYIAMIHEARPECPDLRDVIVLDDEWRPFLVDGGLVDPRRVIEREQSLDPADAINIQYTSGTTGSPKGATLSHRNILGNGHFTAEVLRYGERDRVCVPVPFHHCFGMVLGNLAAMTHGACVVGYWDDPQATARAIDGEGWMHSGDLAVMDDEGYVSVVGRIKDMIIRGGENIYPREVEEFLYTLPQIDQVEVIGVPSARYGEEVMAWVRPRQGADVTAQELIAASRGRIATYKIPRYWKFVDSFPMTVTGKTQKYRMREIAIEELELEAAA